MTAEYRILVTTEDGRSRSTTHICVVQAADEAEATAVATQRVPLPAGWRIVKVKAVN